MRTNQSIGRSRYIPPVAFTLSCLLAIVCPFFLAMIVTCQVPPLSSCPGAFVETVALVGESAPTCASPPCPSRASLA